jgi:hypothetical protein
MLKVRARKTPESTFGQVTKGLGISRARVRDDCKALLGYWVEFKDVAGWTDMASVPRSWDWGPVR